MNNKPVAWMDEETGCFVYSQYDYEDLDEHGKDGLIPLYTHPVKELTDDEIHDLMDEIRNAVGDDIERAMYRMARAILRKASEK